MSGVTVASEKLKNKLKQSEGLGAKLPNGLYGPYQDHYTSKTGKVYVDKVTIGYGNTFYENGVTVKKGDKPITFARATQLFNNILATFEAKVNVEYSENLNQNEFDALVHYVYNHGSFGRPFQLATHNFLQRQISSIQLFSFWIQDHVQPGGVLIDNLVVRRRYEANLFLNTNFNASTVTTNTPITDNSNHTVQDKPKPEDAYLINEEEQTLDSFAKKHGIIMSSSELLNYKQNPVNIFKSYTDQQKTTNKQAVSNLIGAGAKVTVPMKQIDSRSIYTINQTIIYNTNYNAFIGSEIKKFINNSRYQKLNKNNSDLTYGSVFKRQDALSVWLWCKSTDDKSGNLIDITNYVENISTTVTKEGGNFSVTLPWINYKRDDLTFLLDVDMFQFEALNNIISKNTSMQIATDDQTRRSADNSFYDTANDLGYNGKYWKRNRSYFQDLLQNNDLIFIKFEKMVMDQDRDQRIDPDDTTGLISSKELFGGVFDMIGLVDTCSENSVGDNSNKSDTIRGRDLSKLLIDDGTYFFPVEYAAKSSEDIIKNSSTRKSGRRMIIPANTFTNDKNTENYDYSLDGGITPDVSFNFDKAQTIKEWITFIFSQLTNIQICPDVVFSAYTDKTLIVTSNNLDINTTDITYKTVQANGVWAIVKLVLDDSICNRKLVDSSLVTDTGSLLNLLMKVCPEPFCEVSMDTYGDNYYFMVRKPPFSYDSFITNKCINIYEDDVINDSLDFSNEVYTWYKINPFNSIFGSADNNDFLVLFPAVMFPEYMDIWGMKVLEVTSNFIDFDHSTSSQTDQNFDLMYPQALEDMDWLMETHAYLPFTRTGTITIKSDRRIKRGMNIRFYGTGEIFYVDSVTQSRVCGEQVDGYTVLNVSRGMVEEYLDSYFKIIKLRKYSSDPNMRKSNKPSTGDIWTVDKNIFDFFVERRQFS